MAVVIFEGASGVGKGTVAKSLANFIHAPVYRPFRRAPDSHQPGDAYPELKDIPMRVNTWREDLVVADLLGATHCTDVILDRSLISGLAYDDDMWDGMPPSSYGNEPWLSTTRLSKNGLAALRLWVKLLSGNHTILVLMRQPYEVRRARGGRVGDWEAKAIDHVVCHIPTGNIRVIIANGQSPEEIIERVMIHGETRAASF